MTCPQTDSRVARSAKYCNEKARQRMFFWKRFTNRRNIVKIDNYFASHRVAFPMACVLTKCLNLPRNWRLGFLLCMAIGQVGSVCAGTLDKIRETQELTIAHREASIPFSYYDDNNKPVGYAIDLCHKVAEAIKRELHLPKLEVKYLPVNPATRVPALLDGRADIECGSTTDTLVRQREVAFSIPYFVAASRMIVRADSGIENWRDLRDKTIATTRGTTNAQTLEERGSVRSLNMKMIECKDHAEGFSMVKQGSADAFAMDDVLLYGLRAKEKNATDFRIVGDSLSAEPYAIMLRKDDLPFKSIVDREMARIMLDGELYAIYDKWFKRPIPPNNINMNMPMGLLLRSIVQFPTDKIAVTK